MPNTEWDRFMSNITVFCNGMWSEVRCGELLYICDYWLDVGSNLEVESVKNREAELGEIDVQKHREIINNKMNENIVVLYKNLGSGTAEVINPNRQFLKEFYHLSKMT